MLEFHVQGFESEEAAHVLSFDTVSLQKARGFKG